MPFCSIILVWSILELIYQVVFSRALHTLSNNSRNGLLKVGRLENLKDSPVQKHFWCLDE